MSSETKSQHVFQAISEVQGDLASIGIGKDGINKDQRYFFRGIDQVYNTLSPILARRKLCILPRVNSREMTERKTRSGGAMFSVVVDVDFQFVSGVDGSSTTIRTFGEGMDTSDKATNKAMSAAYKYAAIMAFAIPVDGMVDADSETPEVGGGGSETKPANAADAGQRSNSNAANARQTSNSNVPNAPQSSNSNDPDVQQENCDKLVARVHKLETVQDLDRAINGVNQYRSQGKIGDDHLKKLTDLISSKRAVLAGGES